MRHWAATRQALIISVLVVCNVIIYYGLWTHKAAEPRPIHYDLTMHLNNRGFGLNGDFDGMRHHFTCPELTDKGVVQVGTVPFQLGLDAQLHNEVAARGQVMTLPSKPAMGAVYLLMSASHGPVASPVIVTYQDGSSTTTTIDIPDWKVRVPKHHITRLDPLVCQTDGMADHGLLFLVPLMIDPTKRLSHLTMPATYPIGWMAPALHLLGITTYASTPRTVRIVSVQPSFETWTASDQQYRIIRVRIHNIGTEWLHRIRIESADGNTLLNPFQAPQFQQEKSKSHQIPFDSPAPYHLERLAPGHLAQIQVAVPVALDQVELTISASTWLGLRQRVSSPKVHAVSLPPITSYQADIGDLARHEAPTWLRQSKFGIFIHWGVYAVPAWAPVGQSYSEWYWWDMMHDGSATQRHHRDVFGANAEYDDFIAQWDTSAFDPYHWLDLVDQSKARYFVFTTKHHDGIALFNTSVSARSTLHFPQQQDFVGDLMSVAKRSYPHLRRGLYFSMPEWYHPAYRDDGLGWHGPPKNPYFPEKRVSYTGSPPIVDFVNELQVPQAMELIDQYHPDIFWCDIGGINNSSAWQSRYFNEEHAVTVNDRCGNGIADFDTIEYRDVYNMPVRFWEATRGMDPYSFGYNQATRPDQYASTTQLIHELINTVALGGNFLLNIGPEANGHVPEVMQQRLVGMGRWLDAVSPAIFDAEPYWVSTKDTRTPSQRLTFTCHRDGIACYVFVLDKPLGGQVIIRTPLPYHGNALVRMMADPLHRRLQWKRWNDGRWIIQVPSRVLEYSQHAWVFEIRYP